MVDRRPHLGVAVIIRKGNTILLGKRKNAHGEGTWATPGGHLEFGETFEQCAIREVLEETGLQLGMMWQGPSVNNIFFQENMHYVTIFMVADYVGGVPEAREPDKCEQWEWFDWSALPKPLFMSYHMLNIPENHLALTHLKGHQGDQAQNS